MLPLASTISRGEGGGGGNVGSPAFSDGSGGGGPRGGEYFEGGGPDRLDCRIKSGRVSGSSLISARFEPAATF